MALIDRLKERIGRRDTADPVDPYGRYGRAARADQQAESDGRTQRTRQVARRVGRAVAGAAAGAGDGRLPRPDPQGLDAESTAARAERAAMMGPPVDADLDPMGTGASMGMQALVTGSDPREDSYRVDGLVYASPDDQRGGEEMQTVAPVDQLVTGGEKRPIDRDGDGVPDRQDPLVVDRRWL